MPEWVKAQVLNQYLLQKRLVTSEDVVVVDGFWGRGLEHLPFLISVCHGIWGHVTSHDEMPENQFLHLSQIEFRQRLWDTGGKMVAVSDFIADTMKKMWGWEVPVINTGIDLERYRPLTADDVDNPARYSPSPWGLKLNRITIVHGVNDSGNENKGWSHVEAVRRRFEPFVTVESLDDLAAWTRLPKNRAMAAAQLCLIPSGYEGNSLFCLEALACDVPIVAYDVGLPYLAKKQTGRPGDGSSIGKILNRKERSIQRTVEMAQIALSLCGGHWRSGERQVKPREWVSRFSIEKFREQWRAYVEALK